MTAPAEIDLGSEDFIERLQRLRGPCQCGHPPYNPPCSVCSNPVEDWEISQIQGDMEEEAEAERALDTHRAAPSWGAW